MLWSLRERYFGCINKSPYLSRLDADIPKLPLLEAKRGFPQKLAKVSPRIFQCPKLEPLVLHPRTPYYGQARLDRFKPLFEVVGAVAAVFSQAEFRTRRRGEYSIYLVWRLVSKNVIVRQGNKTHVIASVSVWLRPRSGSAAQIKNDFVAIAHRRIPPSRSTVGFHAPTPRQNFC